MIQKELKFLCTNELLSLDAVGGLCFLCFYCFSSRSLFTRPTFAVEHFSDVWMFVCCCLWQFLAMLAAVWSVFCTLHVLCFKHCTAAFIFFTYFLIFKTLNLQYLFIFHICYYVYCDCYAPKYQCKLFVSVSPPLWCRLKYLSIIIGLIAMKFCTFVVPRGWILLTLGTPWFFL